MKRSARSPTEEEIRLWRAAMADAKPLAKKRKIAKPAPVAEPVRMLPEKPAMLKQAARAKAPAKALAPPLESGRSDGLDRNNARRLKRGDMAIDATLDLHGMTREAAHGALTTFLRRGSAAGYRCVIVVTGKGRTEGSGILKSEVPRWLNEPDVRPLLVAFAKAQPKHGGDGALYLLLRRQR
jgi:DNA-nicking Smr family endonuclease